MLARARDAGIRTIDTARAYGDAEQRIGELLLRVPSNDGWRVLTKLSPHAHEAGLGIAECLERTAESLGDSRHALAQEFARQRAEARQEKLRSKDSKRKKSKKTSAPAPTKKKARSAGRKRLVARYIEPCRA